MLCDVPRYFADADAGTGADTTCEAARIRVVRIWAQGDSCAAMSQRMTDATTQLLRDRHDYPAVLDSPSGRGSEIELLIRGDSYQISPEKNRKLVYCV